MTQLKICSVSVPSVHRQRSNASNVEETALRLTPQQALHPSWSAMARGVDEDGELKPPDCSLGSHFWQRSTSWLGEFSVRRALSRILFRRKDEGGGR